MEWRTRSAGGRRSPAEADGATGRARSHYRRWPDLFAAQSGRIRGTKLLRGPAIAASSRQRGRGSAGTLLALRGPDFPSQHKAKMKNPDRGGRSGFCVSDQDRGGSRVRRTAGGYTVLGI